MSTERRTHHIISPQLCRHNVQSRHQDFKLICTTVYLESSTVIIVGNEVVLIWAEFKCQRMASINMINTN